MILRLSLGMLALFFSLGCKNNPANTSEKNTSAPKMQSQIEIIPVEHASFILRDDKTIIYVDPVGHNNVFTEQGAPSFILITDIHGDHFDVETLKDLVHESTTLIVPQAVKDKLPDLNLKSVVVMNNGDVQTFNNLSVEAIPMYNLREEALKFHEKGRGNGYVLALDGKRIYISGDTEDIPEMRNLKNIDIAFVCMNLPYTMTVESAADAVLDFKPKTVYPYHYRGTGGMSDIDKFKSIVTITNPDIDVKLLDWYKF